MPTTADTTQPSTPWLDLLNSSLSGDAPTREATLDLGARIRRLAEHAAAQHLAHNTATDPLIDRPQLNPSSNPSTPGRHGRQPLAQHIPTSPRQPAGDHGTAAKECG